jgi:predicted Rossmann fold flavoprotein
MAAPRASPSLYVQPAQYDVIIIGAGAAGLMCAAVAGARGRRVLVIDHANRPGKKILMSGGGRCNFTNMYSTADNFLSANPHFCKSALARYTPWDFIALVERHRIAYHEKEAGQLFCDESSKQIVAMLLAECAAAGAEIRIDSAVQRIEREDAGFRLRTSLGPLRAQSLIIATGGLSIPKMGATGFGYQVAQQFGLPLVETRAGLVPLTLSGKPLEDYAELAGVALHARASCDDQSFSGGMLFTHRGLSGPAILQISSYWTPGQALELDLVPDRDLQRWLNEQRSARPDAELRTILAEVLPKRLAQRLCDRWLGHQPMRRLDPPQLDEIAERLGAWPITTSGTEGYRTAEVTLGGVDTHALSSTTMAARDVEGLYFIGEVVDVTGHLGGHNFQWAWASAQAAGAVA